MLLFMMTPLQHFLQPCSTFCTCYCGLLQVPVPTTISKSYTIHTDAIHPKELIKSIKKALNSDPSKQQHKKTFYPIPHAVPTPTPIPTPTPWPAPVSARDAFVVGQLATVQAHAAAAHLIYA